MAEQRPQRDTRAAIVAAGLKRFGERGFEATSTREIAAEAGANVASIAYYFGGKEGLRAACAESVVEALREVTRAPEAPAEPPGPEAAARMLEAFQARLVRFLLTEPEAGPIARFMVREIGQPSPALDIIYAGVLEDAHRRICALWGTATGRPPESAEVKIAVFATLGQALYFHLARPVVERRLGWSAIGAEEARAILAELARGLRARIAAERSGAP